MGKDFTRESFYIAPQDIYDHSLLDFFEVNQKIESHERLRGVGVDFYNGEIISYKVYYMVPSEALIQMYPNYTYTEKIGINLSSLYEKSHFHVLRLDLEKKIISDRIDLVYNDRDFEHYRVFFEQLPFTYEFTKKLCIFGFAFEFENGDIQKMNLYYRNRF